MEARLLTPAVVLCKGHAGLVCMDGGRNTEVWTAHVEPIIQSPDCKAAKSCSDSLKRHNTVLERRVDSRVFSNRSQILLLSVL